MNPQITTNADGTGYTLNATAVLLMLAYAAHGEGRHEVPPEGQERAAKAMGDILAAVREGRYPQADILETLLTRGEASLRVTIMCGEAMRAAGPARINAVMKAILQSMNGGQDHD